MALEVLGRLPDLLVVLIMFLEALSLLLISVPYWRLFFSWYSCWFSIFPSQTPPPQSQPQNQSQGQNMGPISLSLQQQRGGGGGSYGFYNQGSQPYMQPGQTHSQMLNQPQQQQSQQHSPAQQSQFGGLHHSQSQLHNSSALGNLGPNSSSSAVNDFQFGQHGSQGIPSQSQTPLAHQQQYGSNPFGASGSAGLGSLTDSFSSMLNLGGSSLSRAPSVSSLTPSMSGSMHSSMGSGNLASSSLGGGLSSGSMHGSIHGSGGFGSMLPGSSSMIGSITGGPASGSVGSTSPASISSIAGHNNSINDSLTKSFGNGNSNSNATNEDKANDNKNLAGTNSGSSGDDSTVRSVGISALDGSSDLSHGNLSNNDQLHNSSFLTSGAGVIGSKYVASSSSGVSSDVNTTNANVNDSNEVMLNND